MNYKGKIRVATDMYEFIELDVELPLDEMWSAYRELKAYTSPKGLPDKDYNSFIDNMLNGEDNHVEVYATMSEKQKDAVQVIKRALARIERKQTLATNKIHHE